MYPEREGDKDKSGEVPKEMNLCVWWIPVCKEQYLERFLSLMAAKATGNMWHKALIRCNLNIQEGGECFSSHAAAVILTQANTFPWHQRVSAEHLFKMKSIDVLYLKPIFFFLAEMFTSIWVYLQEQTFREYREIAKRLDNAPNIPVIRCSRSLKRHPSSNHCVWLWITFGTFSLTFPGKDQPVKQSFQWKPLCSR